MPSDEAYQAVLAELAKLTEAWRTYREVINRAVNLLNHEVMEFKDRLDQDDAAREKRQGQIDAKLESIHAAQRQIKNWQAVRLGVELLAIIAVAAYLYGASR